MTEQERSTDSANGDGGDHDRRVTNIVMLVFFVAIVAGGLWLVDAMLNQKALDDCIGRGGRNCARIDAPAR
jgi:hypothetical protein